MSDLEQIILRDTVKLGADVDAALFVDPDGTLPTAGEDAYGVTYNDAKSGERVSVTVFGICTVTSTAAAIAAGDALMVAANGKVLKAAGAVTVVGRALSAVPAAGGKLRALIIPNAKI